MLVLFAGQNASNLAYVCSREESGRENGRPRILHTVADPG